MDAGNPRVDFNEIEDNGKPGYAKPPSSGSVRNDIGAYGGPYADILPEFYNENVRVTGKLSLPSTAVNDQIAKEITLSNLCTKSMHIDSVKFINNDEL